MLVRVGSRGSRLALIQAERAVAALRAPGIELAVLPITTSGDRDRTRPFGEIGSRGVFVKELEEALLERRIDVAVHSAKDLTATDPAGLSIGAFLRRDDPRDALCGADGLRPGMRIGTASARRKAELLALEPSLSIEPLRGNVDTRLRKRGERGLDAIVLAACGLDRLGLAAEIGYRFEPEELLPEAGQGALALQVRAGEEHFVAAADDSATREQVEAERTVVAVVGGGCLAPVAAHHDGATLTGLVAAEDGSWLEKRSGTGRAGARRGARRHRRRARGSGTVTELAQSWYRARHSRRPTVSQPRGGWGFGMGTEVRRPRVAVTRAAGQADELARRLEAMGCEPVVWPLIAIEPLDGAPVDPGPYDWVVVTSPNGAAELARRLTAPPRQLAAIGPGTAAALREHGLEPTLVPRESTQEGLLAELPRPAGRVLVAAAEGARRVIVEALAADFLPLYRTVELAPDEAPDVDVVLLASPSAARSLARTAARAVPVVVIGPQTAAAARELGLDVAAEAADHDLDGLVAALGEFSRTGASGAADVVRSRHGRPRHGHTGPNGLRPPRVRKR